MTRTASRLQDPLTALLPTAADADRAWLVWYAPGERVELTGRVLDMWQCKIANLLTEEAPAAGAEAGPLVHVSLGVHWRTVTWCCGTWLAGGAVTFSSPADVSVAFTPDELDAGAQLQVLAPRAALAMRWPGSLPPLVLDGVADVMPQADSFPTQAVAGARTAVMQTASQDSAAQPASAPVELSRAALIASLPDPQHATGDPALRHLGTRAALIQAETAQAAVHGVLAAWQAGRTAVLISPDADAELIQTAARQEGA